MTDKNPDGKRRRGMRRQTRREWQKERQLQKEQKLLRPIPASHVISDFPIIYQMPELPTGCEITAATMVLNYYEFQVDKTVMAEQYLPTLYSTGIYYGQDGRTYGNDMNAYFIGDPRTENGII